MNSVERDSSIHNVTLGKKQRSYVEPRIVKILSFCFTIELKIPSYVGRDKSVPLAKRLSDMIFCSILRGRHVCKRRLWLRPACRNPKSYLHIHPNCNSQNPIQIHQVNTPKTRSASSNAAGQICLYIQSMLSEKIRQVASCQFPPCLYTYNNIVSL